MRTLILLTTLLLSSCAITDLLPVGKGVEANLNAGKNVEQNKSAANIEQGATKQTADKISNDTEYKAETIKQITNNMPAWVILLLCLLAGWVIPTPRETLDILIVKPVTWFVGLLKK